MLIRSAGFQGLLWCLAFVVLDAVQAVYFGGVLQRLDAFMIGGLVFGLSAAAGIAWTTLSAPEQIRVAFQHTGALAGLNISTAGAWLTYFIAIQLIEPAVAFTLFSGMIPITVLGVARLGFTEAEPSRNRLEKCGNVVLAIGLLLLAGFTLSGWSGFVRGGAAAALAGLALAIISGILITLMLLYSKRLDRHGLRPLAQFGLRFPLYLVLTLAGFLAGLDDKGAIPAGDVIFAVAIGMLLLAFPIYAVQKAVSLTSSLTIASLAATAPLIVFGLQMIEGRVAYSNATSFGLTVFFLGAVIAAAGTARAATRQPQTQA